ncbi:histidine phosphatase family protein [Micromonospora sp. NBC_01699]|uniref:histidine phosphatase family protein n=1 Tax=Micromonospora sp. NBC_01699 TaxID=2975984 RepID=UPI002E327A0B|nr:histidine phosphatase family protein [Micromonospora sp. NBC_01699]
MSHPSPPVELAELTVVRHGQSTANAAFALAEAVGSVESGVTGRDADIALSPLGQAQAVALGHRFGAVAADRRPQVVLCSPYRRACLTWQLATDAARAGGGPELPAARTDDRLRDRVMGDLELLTSAAIAARFPAEAARRAASDGFHYRPPGGESLLDVAARLGSLLDDVRRQHAGLRVLLVAHDSVVLMLRHLVEGLSLAELETVVRVGMVANASVTRWTAETGRLMLAEYNSVMHLPGE